jgi:hypothetical protein
MEEESVKREASAMANEQDEDGYERYGESISHHQGIHDGGNSLILLVAEHGSE